MIEVNVVSEMLDAARQNLHTAAAQNEWFRSDFVNLRAAAALHLPVADASVDVAA